MNIAVHAAELEAHRVDGTRVYLSEVLKAWSHMTLVHANTISVYHTHKDFNPAFEVPSHRNFHLRALARMRLWTQTSLARALWTDKPDVLWMPVHNMPVIHRAGLRIVVTIHDLAFKKFPDAFPARDVRQHNLQTDYVVRHADHLIAVSHSTKDDILAQYPYVKPEMITVVHHGIDAAQWRNDYSEEEVRDVQGKYGVSKAYLIYVGAIQPRKNLVRLVQAYDALRDRGQDVQLVLVGKDAWLARETHQAVLRSAYKEDIICTGGVTFEDTKILLGGAVLSVYPSLYEGFGLPLLEAFAMGVPVVSSDNSSLPEVGGDAVKYCDAHDVESISLALEEVITNSAYAEQLISNGYKRLRQFSWEKTARETYDVLTGM